MGVSQTNDGLCMIPQAKLGSWTGRLFLIVCFVFQVPSRCGHRLDPVFPAKGTSGVQYCKILIWYSPAPHLQSHLAGLKPLLCLCCCWWCWCVRLEAGELQPLNVFLQKPCDYCKGWQCALIILSHDTLCLHWGVSRPPPPMSLFPLLSPRGGGISWLPPIPSSLSDSFGGDFATPAYSLLPLPSPQGGFRNPNHLPPSAGDIRVK